MSAATPSKPNIAIIEFQIKNSSFVPDHTVATTFYDNTRGAAAVATHAAVIGPGTPLADKAIYHGVYTGSACPGGKLTEFFYHQFSHSVYVWLQTLVKRLDSQQAKLNGVWLDLHGAMSAQGVEDADWKLLKNIRRAVGQGCIISVSMALQGNVSREFVHICDLLTADRKSPRQDADIVETRVRAVTNLLEVVRRPPGRSGQGIIKKRPYKAWIPIPILQPPERMYSRDAAGELHDIVGTVRGQRIVPLDESLLDSSVFTGYPWADDARSRATVVVMGWDQDEVTRAAEEMANLVWDRRHLFESATSTGTLDECLDIALASQHAERPVFVSDSGDDLKTGGSGDVSWGLTTLLWRLDLDLVGEHGPILIYASWTAPEACARAVTAGIGVVVTVYVTLTAGAMDGLPAWLTGRVYTIKHGDKFAGTEVVLQAGSVYIILTARPKTYGKRQDFTALGIDLSQADVVVVKMGNLHPELADIAKNWLLALTPGGVTQDLTMLTYSNIRRPMWPLDDFGGAWEHGVILKARKVNPSNEALRPDFLP